MCINKNLCTLNGSEKTLIFGPVPLNQYLAYTFCCCVDIGSDHLPLQECIDFIESLQKDTGQVRYW